MMKRYRRPRCGNNWGGGVTKEKRDTENVDSDA